MQKVYCYQLFFNLKRTNSYKENKTPYELAKEKGPNISNIFFRMPPIDLDYAADLLYKYHTNHTAMSVLIPIVMRQLILLYFR